MENEEIAEVFERIGNLLELEEGNPHRIRAYRKAADSIRAFDESVAETAFEGGEKALRQLEGIGQSLARVIEEYVKTGRSSLLENLEAKLDPRAVFTRIPGISQELAERITGELDIHSLEELELAAYDGRLERVQGFGPERANMVKEVLAAKLSRYVQRRARRAESGSETAGETEHPSVELLLKIDAEYREGAERGELKKIAPRRFNPEGKAWLPILQTERGGWSFTALFSNTARAHQQGATRDWVVVYYKKDGRENQCTVITANRGSLAGKRIVRGRERECRQHYEDACE